jgi:predicted Fe-Mo cluster-binding NifX family protein
MKIAVTSQNFRTVTGHAGRARRFLIYDAEPGAEPVEVARLDLPKELAMHEFHGAGGERPHPTDGVDVILSQGFGDGFARRMAKRGIAVFATDKTDPVEAVKAYLATVQASPKRPRRRAVAVGTAMRTGTGTGTSTGMPTAISMATAQRAARSLKHGTRRKAP